MPPMGGVDLTSDQLRVVAAYMYTLGQQGARAPARRYRLRPESDFRRFQGDFEFDSDFRQKVRSKFRWKIR